MSYLKGFYFYILKQIKSCLKLLNLSLHNSRTKPHKNSWQEWRTLEVLSSLSYRTGELTDYLQLIANNVSELIGLDWAVVTLCREGYESILASSIDLGDDADQQYELHGSLTGTVINIGRCLFVEDTSINKEHGEPPEGYFAYIGAPLLLASGEIIGTICAFNHKSRRFSAEDMRVVEIFAERAATAIDNYNLYQKQQEMNLALQSEIKERQEAEQELKKSEMQFRQIAENLEPILWMYSCNGEPIYISPIFEEVWGISSEQLYSDSGACLNVVHPEDRERVVRATQIAFKHNGKYELEFRIIRTNGDIRNIRNRSFPIMDETGEIYRVAGIAEDITERQKEQKATIKAMERLSEIGEIAATIVHEVRNPLTTVLMGLNFFERMELPENARKRLMLALDEAERLKRLLNEILLYAKPEVIKTELIDLNKLTLDLIENISTTQVAIGREIIFSPLSHPLIISADIDKLKQVLINLVQNACEAVAEEEKISVQLLPLEHFRQVTIQVQNGGLLIPPELLPTITKPFFTTKPSGNGLGLAIVKKIVEAHEGKLEIESSAIAGTIIKVILPITPFPIIQR